MGSRRTTTRPSFSNGRSSNGDSISRNGRSSGCSYLSNVRPENRSTLCSVMAQLTEETQPSFETTLKSKAVSENCNVKFSCVVTGYPTPQIIWYKDDVQLDRYCGLPKYEVFRNGKMHSLHIYNCTVEDAAIYQASASNSKGIVSCSGVLEVGEMNEFKIHQRYFAKLKQKAENRRREAEGKENQEPLRTISPDRTQRKRRSTMEAFLSTPSSMEDEGSEESHQPVAVETEARLQEAAVEEVQEKTVPVTNGAVSAVTNGQAVIENGGKSGTYIYDPAQKIFTAHQPKTPFVKKKIKISNSAKMDKSDERKEKDEMPDSVALVCTESVQPKETSEEVMEVENTVSSAVLDSDSGNKKLKSETGKGFLVERPSKDDCVEVTSQRQQTSLHPTTITSTSHTVSGPAEHKKEPGCKDTEKHLEMPKSHYITSKQPKSKAAAVPQQPQSIVGKDITETEHATVVDADEKSNTSPVGSLARRDVHSAYTRSESGAAFPQRPCQQAGDQLSEKETSPCQKTMSVVLPALLTEVTQAHTKMNRNNAPVNLELSPGQCTMTAQPPQRTAPERETTTDDIQTPSLQHGVQAAIDKMTRDIWDHSRGSNESYTALFTGTQKSPLQSPDGGENTLGCNVSPSTQQSQVDTAIKTVEGTEIQVDENLEGNKVGMVLVQAENAAPDEMETESAALPVIEHTEKSKDSTDKDSDVIIADAFNKETEKNADISKWAEETSSELENMKSVKPAIPLPTKTPEKINLSDFQEVQKPVTKVISIAELLRSQLKALDSTQNPATTTSLNATAIQICEELKNDDSKYKPEDKKSMADRRTETITVDAPPRNIKETLMEIYHQLHKTDQDQTQTQDATSPPVQALQKPLVIPPVSVSVDTGTTVENEDSTKQYSGIIDCQKTRATSTSEVNLTNTSISELSGAVSQVSGPPLIEPPIKASSQEINSALERVKDEPAQGKDLGFKQRLTPEIKLTSQTERGIAEMSSTGLQMEEHNSKSVQKQSVLGTDTQQNIPQPIQRDNSVAEQFSRADSLVSRTPEASPLLKKRNCVSPIPSATPQELASGARRKILSPKPNLEEASEATSPLDNQTPKNEGFSQSSKLPASPVTLLMSPSLPQRSPSLQPPGGQTSPAERRSPLLNRKKMVSDTQAPSQQATGEIHTPKAEGKPAEKNKHDPFKAPQVIRKIRAETFAEASGHLKLWCQFFNVLSDSTISWHRNEEGITQVKRNAGDETPVNLAIVQASCKDSGVYGCTITNEYGTDSTDLLLSAEGMAAMSLREDLGVGEEIEMTPMIFHKGVADSAVWGNKFFGRIMMQESHIGDGCSHKVWRAKVIYGLEPVFESGNTCIIKVPNPIAYEGKGESCLIDRNLNLIKQECKIQNLAREYCKIFSAEARVIESFGAILEVIPVYLMYRPANTVPFATVEADLTGVYQKYSVLDHTGRLEMRTGSEVELKCCALQHWIFQWTSGNLLLTRLEGVDTKITRVGISVKSTGHQGLSVEGNPKVFEQFVSQHQCNYFCGLLSLRSLKVMESLLTPVKHKGSKSPLLQRKMAAGSSSPQTGRKAAGSPRLPRKAEQEGRNTPTKPKAADAPTVVKMD